MIKIRPIISIGTAIVLLILYLALGVGLYFAFAKILYIHNQWYRGELAFIAFTLLLYLGLELFSLRRYVSAIYGALEVALGIMTITFAFHIDDDNLIPTIFLFYTSLYIIVRGLDNIDRYNFRYRSNWTKRILSKKLILASTLGNLFNKLDEIEDKRWLV